MDQTQPDGRDRVHPSLRPALDSLANFDLAGGDLAAVRAAMIEARAKAPALPGTLASEERFVPGPGGQGQVRVLVWRSPGAQGPLPAVLQIHGGGYVMGEPELGDDHHRALVQTVDCVVVAVQYALAPEAVHPAPIEDCYAALRWMFTNAAELELDPARIGVSGVSAGGGLAAALALLARDRGEFAIAFQHLIYPMIDDRTCTAPDPHPHTGQYVWTKEHNRFGWTSLLGSAPGHDAVEPYAAAARAADLSGLPPAYVSVGALDLFLEENLEYVRRLSRADVPVELHVYPGAFHGFHRVPDASVTRQAMRDEREALIRFLTD